MADKFDATIITGSLDGKELESSIDTLVKNVSEKTEKMANGFVQSIDKMKLAMKDFALTQKVSVDLMKEAWRNMSSSFDAMVAAQTNATGSGSRKGATNSISGSSITELKNSISVIEQEIQAVERRTQAWKSSRDTINLYTKALRANRADVETYEYKQKRGETLSNTDLILYDNAKKKVIELTNDIKELWAKRGNIPAPTREDLQKYDELQRKLVQLKESLNKAQTPKTVGDLEKQISAEQQYRKEIELGTQELREQNQLIATQKAQLKDELMTEEEKRKAIEKQNEALAKQKAKQLKQQQQPFVENFNKAASMSATDLATTERKLKEMIKAIDAMRKSGLFNETELNNAQRKIDAIKNKIESLRQSRPKTMREILGMDEKSIDDIAKKMRELKRVQIDPNNISQAKQLSDEYSRLKRRLAELQGQNIQATHANNYLAQSFGYIRNRIVYALTLGAMMQFVKNVYEIRSQYELLERSLGVLVNSFENGSRIFQELNNMALESPFTTMELAGAAKQLTAYNFAAKEVVDTTRRLADISSALGVPMERLTYNLGQIRAQTVLTARDARDFANAGLPIVASLAEHFSELEGRVVTTGDVYNRMSKKMVSYNDVMSVLNKMTDEGGKFFEFQAKQAETLKVQINNLDLATNNFFNEFGKANQSLLAAPIQGLKLLLQNWKSIDRVLQSIAVTFGVWKLAQVVAIRQQWAWASACGATAKQMGSVANAFVSVGKSLKAFALNPWTWVFVGIMAVTDLINQFRQAKQAMHELNEEIRNNAKEASDSNLKFLDNKGNQSAYNLAKQNKLTAIDGERAWTKNKEQIEQSAMSANSLVAELSAIPDINERVAKSFEYISSIQKAQAALQDLKDDTIKVSTDAGWFGMFGEGLVSDLKDYAQSIEITTTIIKNRDWWSDAQKQNALTNILGIGDVKIQRQEFLDELETTAQSINNYIVAHKKTDPLQINEIYKRAVVTIKTKNPEIKGELARLFDFELDKRMSQLTKGAIDENASLWDMFMERLKHNSSGAFQDINDDWANSNKKLSAEQKKAIDDNLKYFKDAMPEAYNALKSMVDEANKNLRIQIALTFSKGSLTDFQKEVNKRKDKASSLLDFGSDALLPNSNEILHSWTKRMQDDIAAFKEENKNYQRDVDALEKKNTKQNQEKIAWSKQHIADNDRQIQQRKNLLDLFNQKYEKEKKGRKGSQKDLVLEALKNEIDLIKKAQSEYEKLTKDGASANDALATLNGAFGKTVTLLNSRLASYGLPLLDLKNVVKGNPKETLAFLEKISKALTDRGLSNLERMKVVEVAIEEFKFKVKKFDLEEITNRLKLELDKLKKEFEVALEIDANPELGAFFASIFDIDKDSLPHTITEYEKRVTDAINRAIKERGDKLKLDSLRLTPDDLQAFSKMAKNGELNPQSLSDIENAYKVMHDLRVKAAQDVAKIANDYIKQYGDLSAQLVEVEQEKNNSLQKLDEIYYTEDMRRSKEYLDAKNAILDGAKRKQAKIEFDFLKKSSDVERFLTAIETLTEGQALEIKKKIKQGIIKAFKDGGLTVSQFRKEIKALEDQFDKLSKISSNWMTYLNNGFDGLIQKAKTTGQEVETIGEKISVEGKIDDKDKNFLSSLGSIFSDGGGGKMDITQLMGKFGNNMQGLGKAVSGAGSGMQGAASKFSGAIAIIDTIIKNVHQTVQALGSVIDELDSVRNDENKISNAYWEGFKKFDNYAYSGWENFKNGNIAGAAADTVNSIVSIFNAFSNAKNDRINKQLKESERTVAKLANSYKELEVAIGDALGTSEMAAQKTLVANKKLQLAELERQLQLEKERDSKRRDKDRIIELEGQIIDARKELKDMTDDITNSFMGISSVKDAITSMVEGVVDALRSGEDAMQSFDDNIDDMIAHMIQQIALSQIITPKLKAILDSFSSELQNRGENEAAKLEKAQREYETIANENGDGYYFFKDKNGETSYFNDIHKAIIAQKRLGLTNISYDEWKKNAQKEIEKLEKNLDSAMMPTTGDLRNLVTSLDEIRPELSSDWEAIRALLEEFGLIKGDSSSQLSNLQQGISSISESTANALEAYLNIISQRVFYHGTILEQIRDAVVSFSMDVQLSVQSQMLLQLQNSYQTQMAIQNLLEGTLTPNGRAFSVELIS